MGLTDLLQKYARPLVASSVLFLGPSYGCGGDNPERMGCRDDQDCTNGRVCEYDRSTGERYCMERSSHDDNTDSNDNYSVRAACERLYSCGDVRRDEKYGGIESCVLDVEEDNPSPDCTNCIVNLDCPELSHQYWDCKGFPCGEACCDQYDLE